MLWNDLHNLLCSGIRYCRVEEAARILAALGEANCDPHFSRWRYSIAFNALKFKPELFNEAHLILKRDLGETPSPYEWLLLKKESEGLDVARPVSASKDSLRSRILSFLAQRSNLVGPTTSMMSTTFAREFDFYTWQRSESELAESLCAFVQNENALLSDKIDILSCMAKLAELGPKKQRQQICKSCLQLLFTTVPGRNFGFEQQQDPMSNFRVNSDTISDVFKLLLDVIQVCTYDNEEEATNALLQWIPTVGIADRAEFATRINRLILTLISIQAPKNENLALVLVGHLEAVFTAALAKSPVGSVFVFHNVLFSDKCLHFWEISSPTDIWRKTLLSQWSNHLTRLAAHIEPEVRRVTAVAIKNWTNAKLEFSDELQSTLERLKQDPRNRVRQATREPSVLEG